LRLRFRFDSVLSSPLFALPFFVHSPVTSYLYIDLLCSLRLLTSFRSGSGSSCVVLRRWGNQI
jgi:hypothetical protein